MPKLSPEQISDIKQGLVQLVTPFEDMEDVKVDVNSIDQTFSLQFGWLDFDFLIRYHPLLNSLEAFPDDGPGWLPAEVQENIGNSFPSAEIVWGRKYEDTLVCKNVPTSLTLEWRNITPEDLACLLSQSEELAA